MKKIFSALISALLALTACLTIIPGTKANAAADSNYTLPLPGTKSYGITVFDRYSNGTAHTSYITEYILRQGGTSQPNCVMDIAAAKNTPVYAVADGVVKQNNSVKQHQYGGNNVVIYHNDGSYSYYGHLISQSKLKIGAKVKKGDLIGYVGMSGAATGYHLHFEWSGHDPYCEFKKMGYNLYVSSDSGASKYSHNHNDTTKTMYVVNTDGSLNINQGPSTAKKISSMPEGAACTVYPSKSSGNWYYVKYNGISGYAYGKYLTTTKPATSKTYTGRISGTNGCLVINSKPKAGYDIGYIPEGAYCTVNRDKSSGNWLWVSYNGVSGYAYGKYIK